MPESAATRILTEAKGRELFGSGSFKVHLKDYLAPNRVPGTTDDLPAFTSALGKTTFGAVTVEVEPGLFAVSSAILMPSNSELAGAGMDMTTIKLLDSATNDTWVVTNSTPLNGGNTNIKVHDMTLDWSYSTARPGAAGGTRSSNLTFRNVQWGWVDRVKCINIGQHGIDVSSGAIDYPSTGEGGVEPADPSRFIWIRNCVTEGFADDGITTHHSEHIWIEDNFCANPRKRDNCNGIELDDGSRHITLSNNYTEGCYAGLEIKAHGSSNAAQDVIVNGHRDIGSVRSYNFRHIGFHSGSDPVSTTAKNIIATNLVSINPNNDKGFQDTATPRALAISAYHDVSITGFTAIGHGAYGPGDVAVAIQFRSGHINLCGFNISGWNGADVDLSITTGNNVSLTGFTSRNSAKKAIYTGANVTATQLFGLNLSGPADGSNGLDIYNSDGVAIAGLAIEGYTVPVRADLTNYPTPEHFFRRAKDLPGGVTRLVDLPPTTDYYLTTAEFSTMTDKPAGAEGAYWVRHGRTSSDSTIQTLTRNTANGGLQATYERIVYYVTDTASPWLTGGGAAAITYDTMPAGFTFAVHKKADGTWPARTTARADLTCIWIGTDPSPTGMLEGDVRMAAA